MRKAILASATVLGAASAIFSGCFYALECIDDSTCPAGPDAGDGGDGDGSHPDCSGDPSSKNVTDACGVFAQADAPAGGDGTMAKPFAMLAAAIAAAEGSGKRVYACTSAPFKEAVTLGGGIEVYGGLDCKAGWTWSVSARAQIQGPADAVALTIGSGASGAKVEGFAITAASPSNMTMGGSSIGVAVAEVGATLEECDVKASDAANGQAGQVPTGTATKGMDAPAPDPGTMNACVLPASVTGGAPGTTSCGGIDTGGGQGGKGGITGTNGGDGDKGADGSPMDMTNGLGGAGEATMKCVAGTTGHDGTSGNPGAAGTGAGDALSLGGIANGDQTDGKPGTPGQGGGGGGGAKSGTFCPPSASPVDGPGASGGGGGAGGCGGAGGGGGKAGGSSIAILSLGTKLTLTAVTLSVGNGGKGGAGVIGQAGGAYGVGAVGGASSGQSGSKPGCQGGNGGLGGDGGPGGGGRGGHAIGIAYAKTPSPMPAIQMFTPGMPGNGGAAGNGAPASSNGAPGNAKQCWDFVMGAVCN